MFSTATPQFVEPSELSKQLTIASKAANAPHFKTLLLKEMTLKALPPDDQREGKVVGFFDQGLITGGTILLAPVIGGLTVATYYSMRFGIRLLQK